MATTNGANAQAARERILELTQSDDALGEVQVDASLPLSGIADAAGGGGAVSAPAGPTISGALRDFLGWSPRPDDVQGFVAALTASFHVYEADGVRTWKHRPRGFALQANIGAITGVQASIYEFARLTADKVVEKLRIIEPLNDDVLQPGEALRGIVISEVEQIPAALAHEEGPRTKLVDELFGSLLGADQLGDEPRTDPEDPDPDSHVGELRDAMGLSRELVNDVEQEKNYSAWISSVDWLYSLAQNWRNQRRFFIGDPKARPYLGTQLTLISRSLDVVAESSREFRAALVASFIGPAEQATLPLQLEGGSTLFLDGLLDWVDDTVRGAVDNLQTIQGVVALITPLETLADATARAQPIEAHGFPYLYRKSPIIQSAVSSLEINLWRTLTLIYPLVPETTADAPDTAVVTPAGKG